MYTEKISIDDISDEELSYRLDHLVYSQSMLSCFNKNKKEFVEKYIRGIFWSDDSEKDIEYQENMKYGRDFHLDCERIFLGIGKNTGGSLERIYQIKNQYIYKMSNKKIDFYPELVIELNNRLQAIMDLVVKIHDEGGKLEKIHIWDWKIEDAEIDENLALKKMQTAVYLYIVKESIGKNLDFSNIVMYYYKPKVNKSIKIIYSEEHHNNNREKIESTIKKISDINTYKQYKKEEL